ncbi:MAG: nucleotide exchange factor GrpE [Desulfitobacteriaceae bacterium]|nr:nucleotide exchange factor GrpE [Desulfitobacteriaceae bacterium]MDD4752690.1 nucleotide exchange factor GrpE [Desulfitobacteriaceae bacterium]
MKLKITTRALQQPIIPERYGESLMVEVDKEIIEEVEVKTDTGEGPDQEDNREETASIQDLEMQMDKLMAEKDDLINTLQRLQADFDNYRRRTRLEKEELIKYAAEGVVSSLLPVVDNFERALASADNGGEAKNFIQGMEMIFRQLIQVLSQEGLAPVQALGNPFDPTLHEAVMQVEKENTESNIVIEEIQKGYTLKGKLIRPSMVKVAK